MIQKQIKNSIQPTERSNKILSRRIEAFWKTLLYSLMLIFILVLFGFFLHYIIAEILRFLKILRTA